MSELSCTEVNRRCLQSLLEKQPTIAKTLEKVSPYHMGNEIVFVCQTKEDARKIYIGLCQSIEVVSRIFTVPLKIVHKKQVLYLVPLSNRLQLDSIEQHTNKGQQMVVATLENAVSGIMFTNGSSNLSNEAMEWNQLLESLAAISNSSEEDLKQEILSMPLSQATVAAITNNLFINRLQRVKSHNNTPTPIQTPQKTESVAIVEEPPIAAATTPLAESAEGTEGTENTANRHRELLKAKGLPVQFGVIKSLVPVPPPSRASETSRKKEAEDLKSLMKLALAKLNKSGQKHFGVLDNISRQTEEGEIYMNEFVKLHDFVDTKPKQKEERKDKIYAAANTLIQEMYPGKVSGSGEAQTDSED